jgi:predicted ATPase
VYSTDGRRLLSASWDETIKEWDRESGACLWTSPPYDGVFIAGCDFKGCQFSSPEIEQLVRTYGGNVLIPTLRLIRAQTLRGAKRQINISLGKEATKNLLITGPNGSGKTSLLLGLKQAVEAILEDGKAGEVSVAFSSANPDEAERALQLEHKAGNYRFLFFPAEHLYNGSSFWERLDRMQSAIYQLQLEGRFEEAESLELYIGKVEKMLQSLFANKDIRLEYDKKKQAFRVYHRFAGNPDAEHELNRNALPDGYSAILDIFWKIIAPWEDVTVRLDRLRGLVLIDELESHLHIRMQKQALPCLMKQFPNMQFVLTTHSPYVLNSAQNVVVYDMETCQELIGDSEKELSGWSVGEILQRILGIDSDKSTELLAALNRYDDAVEEAILTKATSEMHAWKEVHRAYEVLDGILSAENPLRHVLERQMVQFGGVGNDQVAQTGRTEEAKSEQREAKKPVFGRQK